jgi:hypothetical protein
MKAPNQHASYKAYEPWATCRSGGLFLLCCTPVAVRQHQSVIRYEKGISQHDSEWRKSLSLLDLSDTAQYGDSAHNHCLPCQCPSAETLTPL